MKKCIGKIILMLLYACISCNAQKGTIHSVQKIPNGKWICVQDSLSSIIVKGEFIYSYYENSPVDTSKYILIKQTCESSYKSSKKEALFLKWGNSLCYEVEGITQEYIELTYTANGKTITYIKQ